MKMEKVFLESKIVCFSLTGYGSNVAFNTDMIHSTHLMQKESNGVATDFNMSLLLNNL
jgi:hypothetical protein